MIDEGDIQELVDMHAVYRMFSGSGKLLYVGMTNDLGSRLDQHTGKRWFPQVATITLQWLPTKEAARREEQRVIQSEHPAYNIVYRPLVPRKPSMATTLNDAQVTLHQAVLMGILRSTFEGARKLKARDETFPRPVGIDRNAHLYDADALRAWEEARRQPRRLTR